LTVKAKFHYANHLIKDIDSLERIQRRAAGSV